MQKILIDTDPGQDIDDLLAIHFALLRPELDIRAITTVNMPAVDRARLVKRLLRYHGREEIPVAAGMEQPLRPFGGEELAHWQDALHAINHRAFAEPDDPRDDPGREHAVDLIIRTVQEHPGEIMLACIAPLANIAVALRREPSIAGKIQSIAMMGGETALNRLEHNVAFDYNAADIVLTSGVPIVMGTWDVTRRFVLAQEDCERLRRHPAQVNRALARAIDLWQPAQNWKPTPVMYDVFPMVWAVDRSYYQTERASVVIETRGEHTRGMTVRAGDATHIEVTTGIRAAEVRELYLQTVLGITHGTGVSELLALCGFAFLAGFIDSVVGGGGLIQVPALLILLPPSTAVATVLGTGKLAAFSGTAAAAWNYTRQVRLDWRSVGAATVGALVFAALGARAVSLLNPALLRPVVLGLLVLVAIYTFVRKDFGSLHAPRLSPGQRLWIGAAVGAIIGFYDGFFGPGTGSFLIFIFVGILGFDFLAASAAAKVINSASNVSALGSFMFTGHVLYGLAVPMAACNILGSLTGTRLAILRGSRFVRWFFLAVVSAIICKLAFDLRKG